MKTTFLFILTFLASSFNPALCREIKIGLLISKEAITISSNGTAKLINQNTDKEIERVARNQIIKIKNLNGTIQLFNITSNSPIGTFKGPVQFIPEERNTFVACNNNWYRGKLLLFTNNDPENLTIINNVEIEDYLLSVVPSEIPSSWHREVLKAQAIAARSYSLGYLGRRSEKGYDLESTVEDQVYLGVKAEKKSTSQSVKETQGIILLDSENRPLIALYHSSGGGYTDSIENLWEQEPSPHIQPRPDFDNNSPYFTWHRNYKISEFNKLFSDLQIGEITNISPLSRSISNRVTKLELTGTNGKELLRGEDFRRHLGLPSSKFNISIENQYVKFSGRGFGHGLGMSQWGAKALAEKGLSYTQILSHYYPGAKLVKMVDD